MLNSKLICTRNFSSFKSKHRNILLTHRAFGWTHEQLGKQFLKHSSLPSCLSPLKSLKRVQEAPKRLLKSQRHKTHKSSVYRGPCYPICLHKVRWRGFHSSSFPLAKSANSDKPSKTDKTKANKVKKTDEYDQSYIEKRDVCRPEKVKCDKSQLNKEKEKQKPKKEKKVVDPCKKTCLPTGKCDLPRTVPPPKMTYAKVTCDPPKFEKPKPCPPVEHFQKDDKSDMDTRQKLNARKQRICTPPPLPKPPYAPIILCPCPPPSKMHPGPCPQYEFKESALQRPKMQPCRLKKKHPCPTGVFYCPPQKKPCKLKQESGCERRKRRKAPAS